MSAHPPKAPACDACGLWCSIKDLVRIVEVLEVVGKSTEENPIPLVRREPGRRATVHTACEQRMLERWKRTR